MKADSRSASQEIPELNVQIFHSTDHLCPTVTTANL
jgi:hypothetical protein